MPERFIPWDRLCMWTEFAVCTPHLWQGVRVGVATWRSFTDVRREISLEAGVHSAVRQLALICSWAVLTPASAHHVEPHREGLSHRSWGLGSGPGLGLSQVIMILS